MENEVIEIVSTVMDVPVSQLNGNSGVDTVAEWDSMNHIILIAALEDKYQTKFSTDQIAAMINVMAIVMELEKIR